MSPKTINILLGCTGSVASVKIPLLCDKLIALENNFNVKIYLKCVTTQHSRHFFDVDSLPKNVILLNDEDEWTWNKLSDPVLHIELRRWADLFLIAPLDANSLGKLVNGICDNLLTCVARAWDPSKPFLFCPAMNTYMWNHPITSEQILKMTSFGYTEIPCIKKKLACGDEGFGAMAEVDNIVRIVTETLNLHE